MAIIKISLEDINFYIDSSNILYFCEPTDGSNQYRVVLNNGEDYWVFYDKESFYKALSDWKNATQSSNENRHVWIRGGSIKVGENDFGLGL